MKHCTDFIILDNVEVSRSSYSTRTQILGKDGKKYYIFIPLKKSVMANSNYHEIKADNLQKWNIKLLNKIKDSFYHSPYFKHYYSSLEEIFEENDLSVYDYNFKFIKYIHTLLNFECNVHLASSLYNDISDKNNRNIELCKKINADVYLSGTGAFKYNDDNLFKEASIQLKYSEFSNFKYPHGEFTGDSLLSTIDCLFYCGHKKFNELLG